MSRPWWLKIVTEPSLNRPSCSILVLLINILPHPTNLSPFQKSLSCLMRTFSGRISKSPLPVSGTHFGLYVHIFNFFGKSSDRTEFRNYVLVSGSA